MGVAALAKITFKKGDDYAVKLSRLGTGADEIAKKAIYAAAGVVADRIKSNLSGVLSPEASGEMAAAFGISKIETDSEGNWNAKIGFEGYDSKGTPHQLKARALESGTSRQPKRPFVRPAVNATKSKALETMKRIIDEETEKLMGGK